MNGLGRNSDKNSKKQSILTRETFGVVLILFTTLCLVCLITRETVFSLPGQFINAFLHGCFGAFAYAVVIWLMIIGVMLVTGKNIGISSKKKTLLTLAFFLIALLAHVISMSGFEGDSYGEYLAKCYTMAEGGISTASAGGVVLGLVAYFFSALLTNVGSYVVVGICLVASIFFLVKEYPIQEATATIPAPQQGKQKLFVNNPQDFALRSKRDIAKNSQDSYVKLGFAEKGLGVVSSNAQPTFDKADIKSKLDYIKTPVAIDMEKIGSNTYKPPVSSITSASYTPFNKENQQGTTVSDYISRREDKLDNETIPHLEHDGGKVEADDVQHRAEVFGNRYASVTDIPETTVIHEEPAETYTTVEPEKIIEDVSVSRAESVTPPFIEELIESDVETNKDIQPIEEELPQVEEKPNTSEILGSDRVRNILFGDEDKKEDEGIFGLTENKEDDTPNFTSRVAADNNLGGRRRLSFEQPIEEKQEEQPPKPKAPINRKYHRPPLDLLETHRPPVDAPKEDHEERMSIIQKTLAEVRIEVNPQSYVQGPSVTRYELFLPDAAHLSRVPGYADSLKMRLRVEDNIRIEAPIPGKDLIGVEVANKVRTPVGLKDVMEGMSKSGKNGSLMFALGKDVVGNAIGDDLAKGPHYLIAGATGSGKSVCLHVMICSLLLRYSPEELKLVLVDPKLNEFNKYEHIPHLLVDEIVTDTKRAITLLQWAYEETTRRNEIFAATAGMVSNIDEYNSTVANETTPKIPRVVFFIDELADLMEANKKELEEKIRKVAAKSRSAGIHLVLATQRPSVDVVTGTIKTNLPSRIALKLMNFADSQTILSKGGAEKLLGNGDMLYQNSKMSDAVRYQGAFLTNREIMNIVNYIKENNKSYFDDEVMNYLEENTKEKVEESPGYSDDSDRGDEVNELFIQALWLAVSTKTISISQLQRRYQIGYAKAGGLVDKMERMGFVSGNEGSKARRVLLDKEGFESRFGTAPDSF